VAENLPVGSEIFKLEAHPRSEFKIEPIDNSLSDVNYFKYVDIDDRFVAIKLNQSLEDLVDRVSCHSGFQKPKGGQQDNSLDGCSILNPPTLTYWPLQPAPIKTEGSAKCAQI